MSHMARIRRITAAVKGAEMAEDNGLSVTLDAQAYDLWVVHQAAYRLSDRLAVQVAIEGNTIRCALYPVADGTNSDSLTVARADFLREVTDQMLRARIREATEPVRNLILAYTFSRSGLQK